MRVRSPIEPASGKVSKFRLFCLRTCRVGEKEREEGGNESMCTLVRMVSVHESGTVY